MKNTTQLPDDSAASGNRIMLRFIIPLVRLLATSRQCGGFFLPVYNLPFAQLRERATAEKFPLKGPTDSIALIAKILKQDPGNSDIKRTK
jgi:hypothetical protein